MVSPVIGLILLVMMIFVHIQILVTLVLKLSLFSEAWRALDRRRRDNVWAFDGLRLELGELGHLVHRMGLVMCLVVYWDSWTFGASPLLENFLVVRVDESWLGHFTLRVIRNSFAVPVLHWRWMRPVYLLLWWYPFFFIAYRSDTSWKGCTTSSLAVFAIVAWVIVQADYALLMLMLRVITQASHLVVVIVSSSYNSWHG